MLNFSSCSVAVTIPPSTAEVHGTVAAAHRVVVPVGSTEHLAVSSVSHVRWSRHRITGVSAVPGHRQSVVTGLVTDGERRVLCRVP